MAVDLTVARTAYQTARGMSAGSKVMLALFEAGLVESGMQNLNYGDRDSLGFLQQRANWGSRAERLDVAASTRKFVTQAKAKEKSGQTAGQLAQAVQVSAYPLKYDAVSARANALILQVGNGTSSSAPTVGNADFSLGNKDSWQRIAYFGAGAILLYIALIKLTASNPTVQAAAKAAVKVAAVVK